MSPSSHKSFKDASFWDQVKTSFTKVKLQFNKQVPKWRWSCKRSGLIPKISRTEISPLPSTIPPATTATHKQRQTFSPKSSAQIRLLLKGTLIYHTKTNVQHRKIPKFKNNCCQHSNNPFRAKPKPSSNKPLPSVSHHDKSVRYRPSNMQTLPRSLRPFLKNEKIRIQWAIPTLENFAQFLSPQQRTTVKPQPLLPSHLLL